MFTGNGWMGPYGNQPRFFPPARPPGLLNQPTNTPNFFQSGPTTMNSNWLPPPPPPPVKLPRFGVNLDTNRKTGDYLASPKPWLTPTGRSCIDVEELESTKIPKVDEKEWKELTGKINRSLTTEHRKISNENRIATKTETLMTKPVPPEGRSNGMNPLYIMDSTNLTFPKKRNNVVPAMLHDHQYTDRYNEIESDYIVQTKTKLVRNRTVLTAKRTNLTWTRDAAPETANTSADSETNSPEPEVTIQLQDAEAQSSEYNSPDVSPSRVVVVCEEKSREKEKVVQKTVYNRGQMSLRNINGHKVTGDSRECFAFLTDSCKSGIFCRFEHKGSTAHAQVKVCQRFLRGLCRPDNEDCPLEHAALLPHQYPLCVFYSRGDCSAGDACRLLHTKYSTSANQCPEFLRGTCHKGDECDFPHCYPYSITKTKGTMDETAKSSKTAVPPSDEGTFRWIED